MNWRDIKLHGDYLDLSEFGNEVRLLRGQFFNIGGNAYANTGGKLVQNVHRASPEFRVTRYIWAPSDGSALRSGLNLKSNDDGMLLRPPEALLLDGWRWTYNEILVAAASGNYGPFRERPHYDYIDSIPGNKIGRQIHAGKCCYFFRELSGDDDCAFSVAVVPFKILWSVCD